MKFLSKSPFRYVKKRAEFLAVNDKNRRIITPGMVMLGQFNKSGEVAVGLTASRRVGGAVQRNRAKRRMRALVDDLIRLNPAFATRGLTLVLIARNGVLELDHDQLKTDFANALKELGCTLE